MGNSSEVTTFVLGAYVAVGALRSLYFALMLVWYLGICASNMLLIAVIVVDKKLHEPMYLLMCNLFVSEINGSTAVYPLLLSQMYSDTHQISLQACFLQMFHLYTCASVQYGTFAAMAYDRYVSICTPLYYNVVLTNNRAAIIVVLIWSYSTITCAFLFLLIINMKFCGHIVDKVFCDHHLVIKLACSASTFIQVSDMMYAAVTVVIPFCLISVSYLKIIAVCLHTSKENRQKAVATCTPQIITLSNMFIGTAFHFVDSRFGRTHVPREVRLFLSVYLFVCQPVLTPYLYGFKFTQIKESCGRVLVKLKCRAESS